MTDRYHAAACQTDFPAPAHRREIAERTRRMCAMVDEAVIGYEPFFDVRLVVFPEFAHAVPIHSTVDRLISDLAVELPNEHTEAYAQTARKHGCFIQTGSFLEIDPKYPGHLFNTTCLIGPAGLLARYRKINPWLPWEVHSSPHDIPDYEEALFPVVETEIGRLGVAICYDWLFPETIRQIAFNGAEVIIRVSAYMDPWGTAAPMDWWTLINRTRAIENTVCVVAANQGASLSHYPPFSWPGGSMVVDYDGRVLAQAEPGGGERIVVGPVDLAGLRAARERRRGHDMRAHLRSEAHDYLQRSFLEPAGDAPVTMRSLNERTAAAKRRLADHGDSQ
ncbi:MAG: nitrilase-related carbon-nitrogen hydrolase [Gammaproteobacteria bacterium]|jgi:predicted amidohydrolase